MDYALRAHHGMQSPGTGHLRRPPEACAMRGRQPCVANTARRRRRQIAGIARLPTGLRALWPRRSSPAEGRDLHGPRPERAPGREVRSARQVSPPQPPAPGPAGPSGVRPRHRRPATLRSGTPGASHRSATGHPGRASPWGRQADLRSGPIGHARPGDLPAGDPGLGPRPSAPPPRGGHGADSTRGGVHDGQSREAADHRLRLPILPGISKITNFLIRAQGCRSNLRFYRRFDSTNRTRG